MKKCPNCGCTEFQVHQIEDHVILVDKDGEFIEEKDEFTQITHAPDDDSIWQCDDCGFTGMGRMFIVPESRLTKDDVDDFKAEIVDVLEELFQDRDVSIPNDEKAERIKNGEDPENFAIIYGSDYNIIGDVAENIANIVLDGKDPIDVSQSVNAIMNAYEQVAKKAIFTQDDKLSFTDICGLKELLTDVFENWNIK